MIRFTDYLSEEFLTERKNTHLTHLEDVVLDDGPSGAPFALDTLKEFARVLNGGSISKSLNVSVKWDGAPAIVFGKDPTDGKFFVATKGAFSKAPKLGKSHADIDALYPAGLAEKMHIAFDALRKSPPSAIVQGDFLFVASTVKEQAIEGKNYYAFQPNTILYAVDVESVLGKRVASADMGLVVHTMYQGKGPLDTLAATAVSPGVFSSIRVGQDVLLLDAGYDDVSGTVTFTNEERADFVLAIASAENAAKYLKPDLYEYILEEPFHGFIAMFVNDVVKQGRGIPPAQAPGMLVAFLKTREQRDVETKKSEAGKASTRDRFNLMYEAITRYRSSFVTLFQLHAALTRAKNIVVRKLGQGAKVASFVPTETGYRVTGPEGFVAVAHNGKAVKLVDRLEFSRINLTTVKNWK